MKFSRADIEGVKRHPVIFELFRLMQEEQKKKYSEASHAIRNGNVAGANYNLGLGDSIQRTFDLLDSLGQDAQNTTTTLK